VVGQRDRSDARPRTVAEANTVLATRVSYPGAPHPRWWQIEEAQTDVGGYASDRSHFATLLLIEIVTSHSDDWFTFPVAARSGHVLTLHEVTVVDAFGDSWDIQPPDDGWSLFGVTGLGQRSLVLWPAVPSALTGPLLDQVDFGVDEDANLVWAVERRVAGRELPPPRELEPSDTEPVVPPGAVDGAPTYTYQAATEVPPHWHPYLIETDVQRPASSYRPGWPTYRIPAASATCRRRATRCCGPAQGTTPSRGYTG
jgi:hypothetical protein